MITESLLKILVCPDSGGRLTLAHARLLDRLNAGIARKELKNKAGQTIEHRLTGALLTADESQVYPIVDDIPMLLVDEAIELAQLT